MPIPYQNLTQNISSFPELMRRANEVSAGEMGATFALGYSILLIVTIVTFIALHRFDKEAYPATFFVSFVTAVFLGTLTLIPDNIAVIPLIATVVSIGWVYYEKS